MGEQPDEGTGQMNIYLAITITVLWYICYPIAYVAYYAALAILFALRFLYRPLAFLLQPLIYLGRFLLACLIAPFELLGRFETVYIYLGIAALVGIVLGLVQRYLSGLLFKLLRLDTKSGAPPVRTAKEYREAKRREQAKAEAPLITAGPLSPIASSPTQLSPSYLSTSESTRKFKRSRGVLNQTIMEEMESDY
ncbi:hypothetical protein B0A55_02088 [Friedmanniomyces simplex]|uniref:Uncharacterized protein n=1 Tax=Friedmanniomyces simplex TaxID=329884 RepID=A0A4V5NHQ2_9PEZI|nr:hypothetical protein B0A55_02088 [Friedmanniomyces simplex]